MRALSFLAAVIFLGCGPSKNLSEGLKRDMQLQQQVDAIAKVYAPDRRTTWFRIEAVNGIVKGETSSPEAKTALLARLNASALRYIDSIKLLPNAAVGEKDKGVITISVANIRVQPSHKAELATQATMGTTVRVWKKERGWYLIQTPDQYFGWVDSEAIQPMDAVQYANWMALPKIIYTSPFGFAYAINDSAATITDLVYGDVLAFVESDGFSFVQLPDGRKGRVNQSESMPLHIWRRNLDPQSSNIVSAAKKMLGIPYLWGGTSFKGVDCSGFTKTVYFMNGIVLPRDANQQAGLGKEVNTSLGWSELQPGDLLFFGSAAKHDTPERVVHVGIWIGNNEFIHASGKVQVASVDPAAPNYDAFEHRRFLRATRILPNHGLFDLRTADLF